MGFTKPLISTLTVNHGFALTHTFVLLTSLSSAQVQTGTPPFGSFAGGPEVIDLANLNAHWGIPVLHKPGRGTDFTYDLSYDSSVWYPVGVPGSQTWTSVVNWGWTGQTQIATGYVGYTRVTGDCGTGHGRVPYYIYTFKSYYDQFGTRHPMSLTVNDSAQKCDVPTGQFTANTTLTDGSGYKVFVEAAPTATVYSTTGTKFVPPLLQGNGVGSFTDRNGNKLSVNASGVFTDTLGMTALSVTGTGSPASPIVFTYTTSSGSPASYTMRFTTYTVQTAFGCSGITDYGTNGTTTAPLVSEIELPDGSKYIFAYEPTPGVSGRVTGRIASVTLPTGGTVTYTYLGGSPGHITCADGSAATLTRQTSDGTWNYARTQVSGTQWQTIVTDPTTAANQTSIQFQGIYETQRKSYQGATTGTLLQTVNTCYNAATIPCTTTAISLPITQRTTQATLPGSGNLIAQHTDKFDSYGNLTESDDYDLATGTPFPLLRQTLVTYASLGTYLNAFAQTVIVKDGTGTIKSRVDTNYDQYSSFTGGNCITGAPSHDDAGHGCSFTARANMTSRTAYTNPTVPSGPITKAFTYDSLGNIRTAQLSCCQLKTWAYSTATSYAYPDSVTSGSSSPQLTTSATYDLNMGLPLTTTDENNVTTTRTYDSIGRPLTSTTGTHPAINYTYTDSGNWSVKVCSPVQTTQTACQKTILDGLGRARTTQLLDGTSTLYSATDTQYDSLGRAYKTSNPYTASPSYWTELAFDTLARKIHDFRNTEGLAMVQIRCLGRFETKNEAFA